MENNDGSIIIQAAAARAIVRALGLLADSLVPYTSRRHEYPQAADFERIIEDEGIGHNDVMWTMGR